MSHIVRLGKGQGTANQVLLSERVGGVLAFGFIRVRRWEGSHSAEAGMG